MASKNKTTIPTRTQDTKKTIPVEVKEELLAFSLLRNRLYEMLAAVEERQNSIIEKLIGAKLDDALLADLVAGHNQRAAKLRDGAAVQS